jgi:hypothetical protein
VQGGSISTDPAAMGLVAPSGDVPACFAARPKPAQTARWRKLKQGDASWAERLQT